jgi:hypothetical protein
MEITKDELNKIIAQAVAAGIKEYKRQEKADKQQRDRYVDTFNLMKAYRAALFSVKVQQDTSEHVLQNVTLKANRLKTEIAVEHINEALEIIKSNKERDGKEAEYEAFRLYFIEGRTYQHIAEQLCCGDATPRRWVTGITEELSAMLWGLDDSII